MDKQVTLCQRFAVFDCVFDSSPRIPNEYEILISERTEIILPQSP